MYGKRTDLTRDMEEGVDNSGNAQGKVAETRL
jgi:hypothetical protein